MKSKDCQTIGDETVPHIGTEDTEPLWISDFYDGPLTGAVLHDGRFCWYTLAEEEPEPYVEGWYRRYWLVALSTAQE